MSPDSTNPDHYQFSNGAQTIDITENLTSNGGQAVQYIARSTRIDGANKGDAVEDLRKALWFVCREIERVRDYESLADLPLEAVVGLDEDFAVDMAAEATRKLSQPRVWRTLADAPINVTVLSAAGFVWEHTPLGWRRPALDYIPQEPNWRVTYGPWTEVL